MKVKGKVIKTELNHDGMFARIQLNGKMPKEGDTVEVKWGRIRSIDQNSLYWLFLTWLINDAGMKDQGYSMPEELHEALKGHFLSKKTHAKGGFEIVEIGSTAELNATDFMDYINKIDQFMGEFFGINTSSFWQEYADMYAKDRG